MNRGPGVSSPLAQAVALPYLLIGQCLRVYVVLRPDWLRLLVLFLLVKRGGKGLFACFRSKAMEFSAAMLQHAAYGGAVCR